MFELKFNIEKILYNFFICFIVSLFVSYEKIYLIFLFFIFFLFFKKNLIKIIFINLFFLCFLLKVFFFYINPKNPFLDLIYEKKLLYGTRNTEYTYTKNNGDLIKKFSKHNISKKKIFIKNDNLGFRNNNNFKNEQIVFVGDSFIHNLRISQEDLIQNVIKKKYNLDVYNASLSTQDISHYLETIKFFKQKQKTFKFVMFVFVGNDFLQYKDPKVEYSKFFDNFFIIKYAQVKKFFNFYSLLSYYGKLSKDNKFKKKVTSLRSNDLNLLFYNDYLYFDQIDISFSKEFNVYKKYMPDLVIIVPRKIDVYCNYFKKFTCDKNNLTNLLNKTFLFQNTKVLDSTSYLRLKAEELFNKEKKLIYDYDDTHLNESGIKFLSDFVIKNLS